MIVGGHVSCGYCSAVIAELEPWPAGERREFVCPECGCVNYATPVVEYRSTTFGRELGGPSWPRCRGAAGRHSGIRV